MNHNSLSSHARIWPLEGIAGLARRKDEQITEIERRKAKEDERKVWSDEDVKKCV